MESLKSQSLAKLNLKSFEFVTNADDLYISMEVQSKGLVPPTTRVVNFKGGFKEEVVPVNEEMVFEGVTDDRGPEFSIFLFSVSQEQKQLICRTELQNIWQKEVPETTFLTFWKRMPNPQPALCFGTATFEYSKIKIN